MLPDAKARVSDYLWVLATGEQLLTFVVVVALSLVAGGWLVGAHGDAPCGARRGVGSASTENGASPPG